MKLYILLFLLTISILLISCTQKEIINNEVNSMKISSIAFVDEGMIPSKYTCDGDDISPPLMIENTPANAKSLVLICDDPDAPAGTWDHWVVFNIAPDTVEIKEGEDPRGLDGTNSWGRPGFGGPCPPTGAHRYFFKIYALDIELDLEYGAKKQEIENAMEGHIIEQAQLMGKYKRK